MFCHSILCYVIVFHTFILIYQLCHILRYRGRWGGGGGGGGGRARIFVPFSPACVCACTFLAIFFENFKSVYFSFIAACAFIRDIGTCILNARKYIENMINTYKRASTCIHFCSEYAHWTKLSCC